MYSGAMGKTAGILTLSLAACVSGVAAAGTVAFDNLTGSTPTSGGFYIGNIPANGAFSPNIGEAALQFTAGATGDITQLTASIVSQPYFPNSSIPNSGPNTITVGVFTNVNNSLGTELGTLQITTTPGTTTYGYASGTFASSGILLTQGQTYWLTTQELGTELTAWNYVTPNDQPGGFRYFGHPYTTPTPDISAAAFNNQVYNTNATQTLGLIVDVAPVPLPAAAWLMLSGLAGLGVLGRKRKTN